MKIKSLLKHNLMRAAMTLALILACATAWAQTTQSVTYIDADGQQKTASATPIVDGYDELELTAGQWYVVSSDDVYGYAPISVNGDGAANIILADGATFTYYGMDAIIDGSLNIYGQSAGTGKFDFDNSESLGTEQSYLITGDLTIYGGKVTLIGHEAVENVSNSQTAVSDNVTIYRGSLYAEGGSHPWRGSDAIDGNVYYYGGNLEARGGSGSDMNGYGIVGNIYLSWSSTSDSFYCNRHNDYSSITIEANKFFVDEENTIHSRTNVGSLDGHILQPLTGWHQNGNVYTISDANGWNAFCEALQDNDTYNHFSDKTVKLDADITVTQMAGGSNHAFTGTFDGNHKTLTLNYGTVQAPIDAEFVAPFVEVSGGAEFINLNIDGHIYAAYTGSSDPGVGGLIGHLFGGITIEGCTSTVEVNSTKDRVGGFVGLCEHAVTFTNCKSSAVVTCTGSGSGFVGWSRNSNYTIAFYGCLFNGKVLKKNGVGSGNGGFIGWKGDSKNVTITNCLVDPAPLGEGETMANGNSATFSREHSDHAATITNCYYTDTLGTAQGTKVYSISKGQYVTTLEINGTATQSYTVSGLSFYSTGIKYGDVLYAAENDVVSLTLSNSSGGDVPAGYQYVYSTNAGTLEGSTLTMPDADVIVSAALRSTGQPVSITYIDADGTIGSHDAIALDGTETMLGEYYKDTWYFVGIDINVNHQVQVYKVHLILCNGKSMNFGTSSSPVNFKCIYYAYSDSAITIYGQTLIDDDAGNLNIYSYHTGFDLPNNYTQNSGNVTISSTYNYDYGINSSAVTLNGGKLIVTSIRASSSSIYINGGKIQATSQLKAANNIKLGWTNPDDYIQVSQYNAIYGNVIVAAGKCFAYTASGETTILGGDNETTLTTDQITAIAGKRLYPTVPYLDENGETQQCTEFTLLTGNETTLGTSGQETWYVAEGTLNYGQTITISGNVHLILKDNAVMNVGTEETPINGHGIDGSDHFIRIYGQSTGDHIGTLSVYTAWNNCNGIRTNNLTINGGHVIANTNGGSSNALYAYNGDVVINGGIVEATATDAVEHAHAIYATHNFTYAGGIVEANAASGYAINAGWGQQYTFTWRNPSDRITIGSTGLYNNSGNATATFTNAFTDGTNIYSGTLTGTEAISGLAGKTLYPNCVVMKQVEGYEEGNGGWAFIASPVAGSIAPSEVHNLLGSYDETTEKYDYDLYRFNQSDANGKEWQNWNATTTENHPDFTSLVNGQGYLYATKETRTLVFAGEYNTDNEFEVPLVYDPDADLAGWNLVGNPFAVGATLSQPYYRMNAEGSALKTETETTAVAAMEGVFVQATGNNQTVTFTAQTRGGEKAAIAQANIMVVGNNGAVIDNAIVRFDGGQTLEKFSFREGSTKLYIPQDGKDYAIACAESTGEMPVNFKAETDGTYTISVDVDNVEMGYLHLIDNMTGADIDLLAANDGDARPCVSTYTFTAKTTDYESRFKLVFAVGSSTGSDTIAFFSNGNWIVSNEGHATLQVIDVNGRILISEQINGSISKAINQPAGLYMLRLVIGEKVRTQKIVVE